MRQRCKACGKPDKFDFHVPDHIWLAVVPEDLANKVVCLDCFDDFASKKGVEYAAHLRTLYFVGDAAAFQFKAISAVN